MYIDWTGNEIEMFLVIILFIAIIHFNKLLLKKEGFGCVFGFLLILYVLGIMFYEVMKVLLAFFTACYAFGFILSGPYVED